MTPHSITDLQKALSDHGGALVFMSVIIAIAISAIAKKSTLPLPAGPKGRWLVGNTFQMPRDRPWLQLTEWAREYGDFYSITYCGTPFIVLNTVQACHDLLDARSNIYSDRPNWIMASEIMAGGLRTLFMHYSERWVPVGCNHCANKDFRPAKC